MEWYDNAAVVLLRNPIDAAIAFRNYVGSGNNKTGIADYSWFHGAEWQAYLEFAAYAWADHAVRWIDGMRHGVVAFYENLLHDTEAELKRILRKFYPVPIDEARLKCVVKLKNVTPHKRYLRAP